MGVIKNEVGRPSKKTKIIRGILKLIGILIIIAAGLYIGYVVGNNQDKEKEKNKLIKTTNEKIEELDINSKEVMNLYFPFEFYTHEASDEELYYEEKITPDDLSYEYKNRLAFAKYYNEVDRERLRLYDGVIKDDFNLDREYLKSSTLEKSYKTLFGKNAKYIAKTFDSFGIDTLSMIYDSTNDIYLADISAGDYTMYRYGKELYKAIKVGNKIELYEYVVVYNEDYENNIVGVFSNIEDADNFQNVIKQTNYDLSSDLILENLLNYKDKASEYKLTFEKEDNNYIFKQIEKIK